MGNIGDLIVRLGLDTGSFDSGLGRASVSLRQFGSGLGVAAGVGTLAVALGAATRSSLNFSHQMAEIATLLPDGMAKIGQMTENLKQLSIQYGKAPQEQAAALYEIISAGASTAAQAQDILTTANKLAVGGVTDVKTAADGLTSVMAAYAGKVRDATEVSDAFFIGAKNGKTRVEELSRTIGTVAPIASQMGVSLDEVVAAISALTKGGVSTENAVVGIRQILASVAAPAKEARTEAAALGLAFTAQSIAAKGLSGFLKDVQEKTHGNVEAQGLLFGNIRALSSIMSLTGNLAGDFAKNMDELGNKSGTTARAFQTVVDNSPKFVFEQISSAVKTAAIDVGDSVVGIMLPAMKALRDHANDIVPAIEALTKVIMVGGLVAALANLNTIMGIVASNRIAIVFINLYDAFVSATAAGYGFAGAMSAVGSSLLASVGALLGPAALIAGIYLLGKAFFENAKHADEQKRVIDGLSHAYETLNRNQIDASISAYAVAIAQQKAKLAAYEAEHPVQTAIGFYSAERIQLRQSIIDMENQKKALANAWTQAPLPSKTGLGGTTGTGTTGTGTNVPIIPIGGGKSIADKVADDMTKLFNDIETRFAKTAGGIRNAGTITGMTSGVLDAKNLFPGAADLSVAGQGAAHALSGLELAAIGANDSYNRFIESQNRVIARNEAFTNALNTTVSSLMQMGVAFLASKGWFGQYGKASGAGGNLGAMVGGGLVSDLIGKGAIGGTIGKLLSGKVLGSVLGSILPGIGTIAGGLIGSVAGSVVGKVGGFIGGLFGHHKKKVDDNAAALDKMTKAVNQVNESLLYVPTGFKLALARFDAQDPRNSGIDSSTSSSFSGRGDPVAVPVGDIYIDARDRTAREIYDEMEAERRRRLLARYGSTSAGEVAA